MTSRRSRLPAHLTALLSLVVVAVPALSACGGGATDPVTRSDAAPTTAPSSPSLEPEATTTPTAATAEPRLIPYAGGESPGAEVLNRADAEHLAGAPESFKDFIGQTAQKIVDESRCTGGYVGVTVETLRTDGFAVGGVNDCGGYAALWVLVDGQWTEAQGTQEIWDCAVLDEYRVPSDVSGEACYDYQTNQELEYHQA